MEEYSGAIDKGLEGVVACSTGISSIVDATLSYRGFTIEDLAENSTFEEVSYLLWKDHLPNRETLTKFTDQLQSNVDLAPETLKVIKALPIKGVHPMAWLRSAVSCLGLLDSESQSTDPVIQEKVALRLVAKVGPLVAFFERSRNGKDYVPPKANKSLAWNFLYMLNGTEPDEELAKVFDTCLILHADHELNCSAFAARVTTSSLSDIYSAVVSAIGALKGPLHGGANEQVMRTLKSIGTVDNAEKWIHDSLAKKEKVMGFGHRVYKNGDPRAKILRKMGESMSKKTSEPHWFQMSQVIDNVVQKEKGLLPNVDFYSATVYYGMGIPIDLYTPIFAVSRVTGWLAHIIEQLSQNRIYRPRGEWTGKNGQSWIPISDRK